MAKAPEKLPGHVAIIMDGNGRWARRQGLPRNEGHRAGIENLGTVTQCCIDLGIPVLTIYALSTENLQRRPRSEIQFLMRGLSRFLREKRQELVEKGIRFKHIGRLDELPRGVQRHLRLTEEATADCGTLTLAAAINYGAHREITDAVRAIARKVKDGDLDPEDIDEGSVEEHLYTDGLPALDLLIRTGAEKRGRVSNFLLWQLYYAELYLTDVLWPDFGQEEFIEALRDFARRERRFGGLQKEERKSRRRVAGSQRSKSS